MYNIQAQSEGTFKINPSNNFYIPSGTDIGIGTSNPSCALDINGTLKVNNIEMKSNIALNDNQIRFRSIWDGNHYLGFQAYLQNILIDGPVLVGNKSGILGTQMGRGNLSLNPVLTWNHNGNVGIGGNFEAETRLHIKGDKPVLTIESLGYEQGGVFGTGYKSSINFIADNTQFQIGTKTKSGFHIFGMQTKTSGFFLSENKIVFGMKYEDGGAVPEKDNFIFKGSSNFLQNVGIGTHSRDNYKLAVAGRIICEELKVELENDWPDYVFGTEYHLKDLNQLKVEIDSLGHLPNVPSADQVKEEGIGLGELTRIQMEKIEEITLYLIQLKSENEIMKEQIELLNQERLMLRENMN